MIVSHFARNGFAPYQLRKNGDEKCKNGGGGKADTVRKWCGTGAERVRDGSGAGTVNAANTQCAKLLQYIKNTICIYVSYNESINTAD